MAMVSGKERRVLEKSLGFIGLLDLQTDMGDQRTSFRRPCLNLGFDAAGAKSGLFLTASGSVVSFAKGSGLTVIAWVWNQFS